MQLFPKLLSEIVISEDPVQTAPYMHYLHTPFCQKLWYMKF